LERRAAAQAFAIGVVAAILTSAVRVERGGAVGTDDAEVLEAVVVADPVDVIEDQRHAAVTPQLPLTAQLTDRLLETGRV
jgi:hypothetical protein